MSLSQLFQFVQRKERITEDFKCKITISVKNKKVKVASFREAIADEALRDFKANGFEVDIDSGSDRIDLQLDEGFTASTMSLKVEPPDLFDRSVAFDLTKWAESNRLPALWSYWARYVFFLNFAVVAIFIVYSAASSIKSESEPKHQMRQEAAELVKNGLTDKNMPRAVQLLLEHNFDVGRPAQPEPITVWSYAPIFAVIAMLTLTALLWTYPRSVLAIGKGKTSLWRQDWWMWVLQRGLWGAVILGTLGAIIRTAAIRALFHQG